jgi:hypothetical protein
MSEQLKPLNLNDEVHIKTWNGVYGKVIGVVPGNGPEEERTY